MANRWFTFLYTAPDLAQIANDLCDNAEFDPIHLPAEVRNDAFELQCRICRATLRADLFVLSRDSMGEKILSEIIADVEESDNNEGKRLVLDHLKNTGLIIQTISEDDPNCDCDFRFHQIVGRGHYLWYVDGQFADEVDVWLSLCANEDR